jgi:hypothetical protein
VYFTKNRRGLSNEARCLTVPDKTMRKLCVFATIMAALLSTPTIARFHHYDQPFLIKIGEKYGFMDSKCRMVIPAQYSEAFEFSQGLAAVKVGTQWGYIDKDGAVAIPPRFAGAFEFSDGLASVRLFEDSSLWGFIDRAGNVVIEPQFGMPLFFSEGLVEGYGSEENVLNVPIGYVNSDGKYAIRFERPGDEIEFLEGFSEGLAAVSIRPRLPDGGNGPAVWGYLNHSGKWSILPSYMAAGDFHEGLAAVMKDKLWGYIDKTNGLAISPRFENAMEFSEGVAAIKTDGRWGYIDQTGVVVIQPQFEHGGLFRGGLTIFEHDRKFGYIDKRGVVVVAPHFDWGSEFVNGVAAVSDTLGYRIVDNSGKTVCRLKPDWPALRLGSTSNYLGKAYLERNTQGN